MTYDETGRTCSSCKQDKLWSEFNKGNSINGYRSECRTCQKKIAERYKRDPEKSRQAQQRFRDRHKQ